MPNYISLRDENAFPKFVDLPDDTGIYGGMRKKHWCMIAEIVDMDALVRFVLHVKDKAGTIFKVAFYTDGRGFECKTADVKPGYTVAILYPYQHEFLDLSFGIRVDDPKFVKVRLLLTFGCIVYGLENADATRSFHRPWISCFA